MSRSDADGECPDKGNWCGFIRDWCDGNCEVVEREKEQAGLADLRKRNEAAIAKCNELIDLEGVFTDASSTEVVSALEAVKRSCAGRETDTPVCSAVPPLRRVATNSAEVG